MLFLSLIFAAYASTISNAQVAYSRLLPYDPQYLLRTVPVRRSVDNPEYQRLQLPISRYFPQVDTQVVPAAYIAPKPIAYRLPNGEVYAVPTWPEDDMQARNDEEAEYDSYDDYDNEYGPIYARPISAYPAPEVYGTPQEEPEPQEDQYNDMMVNYLLRDEMSPPMNLRRDPDILNMERKKHEMSNDVDKRGNDAPIAKTSSTTEAPAQEKVSTESQDGTTAASSAQSALSTSTPPKIAAPLSRVHKSGDDVSKKILLQHNGMWQNFDAKERGQKEFPLYRPFQATRQHREAMETLQHELSRGKNSLNTKDAFPMIEKMLAAQRSKDPLAEQLNNLKFRNM